MEMTNHRFSEAVLHRSRAGGAEMHHPLFIKKNFSIGKISHD
jgi:hypothetical protein